MKNLDTTGKTGRVGRSVDQRFELSGKLHEIP